MVTEPRWMRSFGPQDMVWLLLFAAMAVVRRSTDSSELTLLAMLAAAQVAEPKFPLFASRRGTILVIVAKLALGYLLIGYTGGVVSSYYLVLLLPVVSAATSLGAKSALLFTLLACGAYASFLAFVDWSRFVIEPDQMREIQLRLVFLAVVGNLANVLAGALRVQSEKSRAVAAQLASANQSLLEAEAAVRRSERLAALGQLSAGLAHELRNPLGTMKGSAEMLTRSVSGENEVAREVAGFISSEVDRTNSLITRFLEFARPVHLRLAVADITQVVDRAVAQVERDAARREVSIYKNYSPEVEPLPCDGELMERVFYNLLLNATEASPPHGAVTVKTRLVDDEMAGISVIDRGSGIEAKIRESIFNPFFTTKSNGVGLGLAIVSKIVDEHGGRIAVESEPDKGSVFHVYLPRRPRA